VLDDTATRSERQSLSTANIQRCHESESESVNVCHWPTTHSHIRVTRDVQRCHGNTS